MNIADRSPEASTPTPVAAATADVRHASALRKALVAAAIAMPLATPLALAADGDGQQSFMATQDRYTVVWGVGVVHSPAPAVDPAGAQANYVVPLTSYTAPQSTVVTEPVMVVSPDLTPSTPYTTTYLGPTGTVIVPSTTTVYAPVNSAYVPTSTRVSVDPAPLVVPVDPALRTPGYVYPPTGAGWVVPGNVRPVPDVDGPASLKGD